MAGRREILIFVMGACVVATLVMSVLIYEKKVDLSKVYDMLKKPSSTGAKPAEKAAPATQLARTTPSIHGNPEFVAKMQEEHKRARKNGFDHPRAELFAKLRTATTINSGPGSLLLGPQVARTATRTDEATHLPLYRINARYNDSKESLFLQLNGRTKPKYKLGMPLTLPPNEDQISGTTTVTTLERK